MDRFFMAPHLGLIGLVRVSVLVNGNGAITESAVDSVIHQE